MIYAYIYIYICVCMHVVITELFRAPVRMLRTPKTMTQTNMSQTNVKTLFCYVAMFGRLLLVI